jgi:hypothetical protein
MVSSEPQSGRCNASVTDRVGLIVEDDELGETYTTDDDGRLHSVVLERGAVRTEKEPEYEEVTEYLRNGFTLTGVKLTPPDDPESDPVFVGIEDDDPYVMNNDTEHVGFCERYPVDGKDVCYVHGGAEGTGPPEGNTNGMTHGLTVKRSSYYENEMDEEEKILVEDFVDNWIELSSYTRDDVAVINEFYRMAVDEIRLWNAQDHMEDGFVYEQYEDLDMDNRQIRTKQENPANLPYDRLDRTTLKKLKEYGVLDDPDSKQAEATESLAQKFADIDN